MSQERRFKRLNIGKNGYIYYDTAVIDPYSGQLIFASLIDSTKELKKAQYELNRSNSIYIEEARSYVSTSNCKYNFEMKKQQHSDFAHLIANKKDTVETLSDGNELLQSYIYVKNTNEDNTLNIDDFRSKVYDKLYANTSIPLLEEWMPYLSRRFTELRYLRELSVYSVFDIKPFRAYKLLISKVQLLEIVQHGLRSKEIDINNTDTCSELMEYSEGLDSYLNIFGDTLAQRIQESFEPKFDPQIHEYDEYVNNYDDSCFHNGIELYNAQKATIQSAVNNLNKNKVTYLIGEMGCGKTALGSGIAYSHYKKKSGMTNVIMCPSHLVEKWKREVERLVPNGKGYIIKDIKDLIEIERKIKNKYKLENAFIIISKETAKFSYETRPATIWSISKKTFVCPCCGQSLYKKERIGSGRSARTIDVDFKETDMLTKMAYNTTCMNTVRKYNKELSKWEEVECNASLWAPLNKLDHNTGWVKLGKSGWVLRKHIDDLFNELISRRTLNKKEGELFAKIAEAKNTLDDGEELKGLKAPRKYSIAKYIRERFKGDVDYFLCDEINVSLHIQ